MELVTVFVVAAFALNTSGPVVWASEIAHKDRVSCEKELSDGMDALVDKPELYAVGAGCVEIKVKTTKAGDAAIAQEPTPEPKSTHPANPKRGGGDKVGGKVYL